MPPPQTPALPPPPQVCGAEQVPQLSWLPQPSAAGPQLKPRSMHVLGTQVEPQTPGVPPPPQVWPAGQVPQSSWLPQPSPAGPHWMFCAAHVVGVQAPAAADAGHAAAAAGLPDGHDAALDQVAAAVAGGAALDVLRARTWSACRGRAADARRAAAAAGLPGRARAALERAAAAVAGGAAVDVLLPRR